MFKTHLFRLFCPFSAITEFPFEKGEFRFKPIDSVNSVRFVRSLKISFPKIYFIDCNIIRALKGTSLDIRKEKIKVTQA